MAMDPITAGLGLVQTFVGKFVENKDLAARLIAQSKSEEFNGELSLLVGQMEINKIEATHKSIFVSGWRPAIGWICGAGLAYNTILSPFLSIWLDVPPVDSALLTSVLMGMLGLGAMRTVEKTKGVSRET